MPFPDGRFDLIVSNLGLNNFQDGAAAMRECRRVAAQGAALALTTNLQGHMREFYAVFEEVLEQAGAPADVARLREHEAHRATVPGATALLEAHGFSVTRVVERTATYRFRDGTALLNHSFIKLGFLPAWRDVVSGDRRDVFDRLRRALDALAAREGELTLTIPMAYIEGRAAGC
jgi:SAM-dependent methyltransferase